jgi:DNA-binding CsgD family transcriptional regulator
METFRQAADAARTRIAAPDRAHFLARAALGFEDTLLATGVPRTGPADPSILLLDEALRALGEEVSPLKARALAGLARALHFAGVHERGLALSEVAVTVARATGDKAALAYALNARRMAIWGPNDPEARLAVATELKRLAEDVGDTELVLEGLRWREQVLRELGEMDAADAELEAHVRLAEKVRQPQYRWSAAVFSATRAMIAGRFAEAERLVEEARTIGERAQMEEARLLYLAQIGILRRERLDLPGLDALLPSLERAFAESRRKDWLVDLSATFAELGRVAEARRVFDELAADGFAALARDWMWLASIAVLADVCAFLGDRHRAAALYRFLIPHAGHVVPFGDGSGATTRFLGVLAATLERWDEAEAHFEAALRLNERIGARPALARTQQAYAAMLLARRRRGNLPHARDLLAKALALYRELDLPSRAAQVEALLAKPGLATAAPSPTYPAGLTEREVEIVCLIAAGHSNREIAEALFLSVRTVERHITNLYAKIGARGKADATAFAFRHGLASTRGS